MAVNDPVTNPVPNPMQEPLSNPEARAGDPLPREAPIAGEREHIVAMFENYERARTARDALHDAGIARGDMHILDREAADGDSTVRYERTNQGFWGALKGLFVPEAEAPIYTEGLSRGHSMLVIEPPAGRREEIIQRLESFDPVDLEERERTWRAAGWAPSAGVAGHGELGRSGRDRPAVEPVVASPTLGETATTDGPGRLREAELGTGTAMPAGERGAIPVVEEQLAVGKRVVDRGGVRVRSYVTERPVEETVNLHEERVDVERRPVNRPAGTLPEDAFREREIEVSAKGEEPVVRKDARVVEEVAVNKTEGERTETVRDNLRRTDVEVEDNRGGTAKPPKRRP